MLGAKYRFHSRGGVQATLKNGKTERGDKISVVWAMNSRRGTRFGIVVVYAADFREMEHGAFREQLWALLDKIKLS
jgi:RNase P protein component